MIIFFFVINMSILLTRCFSIYSALSVSAGTAHFLSNFDSNRLSSVDSQAQSLLYNSFSFFF